MGSKIPQGRIANIEYRYKNKQLGDYGPSEWACDIRDLLTALDDRDKLLLSLVPGGSEFYGDPERCAEWIRNTLDSRGDLIKKFKRQRDEARQQADWLARAMIWERNRCPAFHPWIPHRKCQMEEPCDLGTLDNDGDIVDDKQGQQWFAQLIKCWRLWASKQPTGQVAEEQGSDGDAEAPA